MWIVFKILQQTFSPTSLSLSRNYSPVGTEGPLIQMPHVVLCSIWQLSGECCVLDLEYISYPGLWIIAYKGGVWLVTGVNEFLCNICRDALHMLAIKGRWWKALFRQTLIATSTRCQFSLLVGRILIDRVDCSCLTKLERCCKHPVLSPLAFITWTRFFINLKCLERAPPCNSVSWGSLVYCN